MGVIRMKKEGIVVFEPGDKVYIGDRFGGVWVGVNPVTQSHVVYWERLNEYRAYHSHQISTLPEHE